MHNNHAAIYRLISWQDSENFTYNGRNVDRAQEGLSLSPCQQVEVATRHEVQLGTKLLESHLEEGEGRWGEDAQHLSRGTEYLVKPNRKIRKLQLKLLYNQKKMPFGGILALCRIALT